MMLGAGRATKESVIDLAVGLVLHKKIGDEVKSGNSLLTIYSNTEDIEEVRQKLYENIKIIKEKVSAPVLIHGEITDKK
jgi:pyrimidine-nucleoside phosphorylase